MKEYQSVKRKKGEYLIMKSMLVIGIGRFGNHLCRKLMQQKNEVLAVDESEERLEGLLDVVTSAKIGDCTNPEVLKQLGVANFDVVFVCIGTNFQSSLEITSLVKEMGAKYVVSKATRDIHAKFLLRNGADEVIYPDREIAENLAIRCSADHVFDYIELTDDYGIFEIAPRDEWIGKSIRDIDFRAKYGVSILGTKKREQGAEPSLLPSPSHIFKEDENLMIIGEVAKVEELQKRNR